MIRYLASCVLIILFISVALAQSPPGGPAMFRVHAAVEEKASLLQDTDQDTYRALADEIFKASRGFAPLTVIHGIGPEKIPPSIDYVIKDRLSWAEMQYRRGLGKGVKEQSIVNLTNTLVEKFGLPDYARTSQRQVRFMRMHLMAHNPLFMGQGATRPNMQIGDSINDEMSPLQATHVLLEVLGHKYSDKDFQLTPEEWDREQASAKVKTPQAQTPQISSPYQPLVSVNPKEKEIRTSLVQHMSSMNPIETLALTNKAFEVLGIQ